MVLGSAKGGDEEGILVDGDSEGSLEGNAVGSFVGDVVGGSVGGLEGSGVSIINIRGVERRGLSRCAPRRGDAWQHHSSSKRTQQEQASIFDTTDENDGIRLCATFIAAYILNTQ